MSALISPCGVYRYWLHRQGYAGAPPVLWCMLNPSTADADLDDATITRLRGFSGGAPFTVINLYALRSVNPRDLWRSPDPVGPENDRYTVAMLISSQVVVCAWGTNAKPERVAQFIEMAKRHGVKLMCFGTNADGSPKHPLYLAGDTALREYMP